LRDLLQSLPRLRLLVTFGQVNRSIDLAAADDLGILVCGTSSSMVASTVELTWALILALSRQIVRNDRHMREGSWQTDLAGELRGKSLGVIGLGTIGSEVAHVGSAFGMRVLAWSPHLDEERCARAGATLAAKDELLANADVITLHIVLSEATRGLIGHPEFALMKNTAYLVNTARGPLINRSALLEDMVPGPEIRVRRGERVRVRVINDLDEPTNHLGSFDSVLAEIVRSVHEMTDRGRVRSDDDHV